MLQQFDERNRDLIVNINGQLTHRDQAGVSPFDSAVQGGDAVWEGLRLYDGRIFKLHEHLARLRGSAKALAFAEIPPREQIIEEIRRTLDANGMRDGVHIRLTLTRGVKYTSGMDPRLNTRGPTLIVLAEHKPPVYDKRGLTLITSSVRRFPPDCLDPKIHHNNLLQSILAKIEANAAGADDALLLDTRGFVAETNATHVFLVRGRGAEGNSELRIAKNESGSQAEHGPRAPSPAWAESGPQTESGPQAPSPASSQAGVVVLTPRLVACPEGITRATVLELCATHGIAHDERDLTLTDVYGAEEMFCTGTMGELAAVTRVDGRLIGDGALGSWTRRLSALYARLTASGGVRVVD